MKKIITFALLALMLMLPFAMTAQAASPYQTYTYSIDGVARYSPDAYVPLMSIDAAYMGLSTAIGEPRDLFVDENQNVYIVDGKNNSVICLDRYYKKKFTIKSFVNENGVPDGFTSPSGVFVSSDYIYVCDTDASRIVMFTLDGKYVKIIPQPESNLFEEGSIYSPVAVAVDKYGRLYVVSSTTYQGIIVMADDGTFVQFVGAQKVETNAFDIIWRRFQTDEQRNQTEQYVSTEFNNIAVNAEGNIYVTTSSISEAKLLSAIQGKSKSGDYAPVKLLNASGDEIMKRNGFYPPSGEIDVKPVGVGVNTISGASKIIDVAIGPEETWSIIDEKRSKIYTYDIDGNLLFAFGDMGSQLGNVQSIEAIAYQGDRLLVLDKSSDTITAYKRTEYGDILIQALNNQNNRRYDQAVADWREILKRNSNFDAAYIGIGNGLYRSAKYKEALEYYEYAYDTENYSNAYKEIRKNWISKYAITIPIVIVAVCWLCTLFMKHANKVNKETALKKGKRTFREELLYGFHVIFHPFDGFWDLKHEKRGSVRASVAFIAIAIISFYYQSIGRGYLLNPTESYSSLLSQIISVLVPLFLWVIANWCLTTLFEGEGSFKDIFIATSYSLVPVPILVIPATLLSNIVTNSEKDLISFAITIMFVWVGFLIFFGTMVTHDYSLGKNVLTTLGTIVGMGFIMFIGILFSTLLGKIVGFISNIIIEINYRL